MRQVSLREFRTRGVKALERVPRGETVLLAGQKGPAYFLVPVVGDIAVQDAELGRLLAKASLRDSWAYAKESGASEMTLDEINAEIALARAEIGSRAAE